MVSALKRRRHYHLDGRAMSRFRTAGLSEMARPSKCLDSRDRVYGLLGLVDPQELAEFPIPIGYLQSSSTLLLQLWKRRLGQLNLEFMSILEFDFDLVIYATALRTILGLPYDCGMSDGVPVFDYWMRSSLTREQKRETALSNSASQIRGHVYK